MLTLFLLLFTLQSGGENLKEKYFAEVSDLIVTKSGIYIADLKSAHIYKFDHKGVKVGRTGRQGRGPGEFLIGPNRIVKAGDRIFALDKLPNALNIFNPDLSLNEVIMERDVFIPAYDAFQYADSLLFLASSPIYGQDFGKYNLRGGLINAIEIPNLHKTGLRGTFRGFSMGNEITLLWIYVNRLDRYSHDGRFLGTCQIPSLPDEVEFEIQQFDIPTNNMTKAQAALFYQGIYLPSGQLIRGVAKAGEYLIVQYGGKFNNNKAVILNLDCEVVHEFTFPAERTIMFYDEQYSRLYYTYDFATRVGFEQIEPTH